MTNDQGTKERPPRVEVTEPSFTESVAVVFTQLYGKAKDGQVFQINITARGNSAPEAIEELVDGMTYAKDRYGFSVSRPDIDHTFSNGQPQSHDQAPSAPGKTPAASAPGQSVNGNGQPHMIHSVFLEVIPESDEKVTLKWYGNDKKQPHNQYPDIYSKRAIDKALELLRSTGEDWQPELLTKPRSFSVKHTILYVDSDKMNGKGNPYKNITELRSS